MKYIVLISVFTFLIPVATIAAETSASSSIDAPIIGIKEMTELPFSPTTGNTPFEPPPGWRLSIRSMLPRVSMQVAAIEWANLARWARPETQTFRLPATWAINLPFEPIAAGASDSIIFGQPDVSEGFPLPSHSSLVSRRLMLFVELNKDIPGKIKRIFITIRGWLEE